VHAPPFTNGRPSFPAVRSNNPSQRRVVHFLTLRASRCYRVFSCPPCLLCFRWFRSTSFLSFLVCVLIRRLLLVAPKIGVFEPGSSSRHDRPLPSTFLRPTSPPLVEGGTLHSPAGGFQKRLQPSEKKKRGDQRSPALSFCEILFFLYVESFPLGSISLISVS